MAEPTPPALHLSTTVPILAALFHQTRADVIISHKHRFIFIKTEKTAGTSIEIALSGYCGADDIITPIREADEEIRQALGYRGPQNAEIPLSRYRLGDWAWLARHRRRRTFYNHASAAFIRRYIDPDVWRSYYKFCFERNPWDKAISRYFFVERTEPRQPLRDFILSGRASNIRGFDLYTKRGEILVDRVCRYENLEEEMQFIAERIGLPSVPTLPRANTKHRKSRKHYRDMMGEEERVKIARVFAREIAYFGYAF